MRTDLLRGIGERRLGDEMLLHPDDYLASTARGGREVIGDEGDAPENLSGRE